MDYVPDTSRETEEMLQELGLSGPDDLFRTIPAALNHPEIPFPPPMTEMEITAWMEEAANANQGSGMALFAGGGAYDHFIPQAVKALVSRGDFATAYTPYQAEASQGTLQVIFEFQTLLCRLTGMEAANASMYDGATALAEAALMACRITHMEKILVSRTVHPYYRRVLQTYLHAPGLELVEIKSDGGVTSLEILRSALDDETAAFFVAQPNYFGCLEPVEEMGEILRAFPALFGAMVYPHALGLLKPPGAWGADVVVGDLQSLGMDLSFGGPYAGFIATREEYIRQLPGRLAGCTQDRDGKVGYVLTLQAREQQIRRAKATSNICTNQALCALAVTVYLALMGPKGMRRAAELSLRRAHELQERLCQLPGVRRVYDRPFFNEFLLELPMPPSRWLAAAREHGLLAGIEVPGGAGKGRDALLICATEKNTREEIDRYVSLLGKMVKG